VIDGFNAMLPALAKEAGVSSFLFPTCLRITPSTACI
jgi:hypothetical protein